MLRQLAVWLGCFVGAGLFILPATPVGVAGGKAVRLTFTNHTDGDIHLFWLDSRNGKEVSYGAVPKGKFGVQSSYHGHVWIVRSAKGDELGRYTVDSPDGAEVGYSLRGPQANLVGPQANLVGPQANLVRQDTSGPDTVATAKEVLRFVNEERKQRGLAPLVEDPALTIAAQKYAKFLAQKHNDLVKNQRLSDDDARKLALPPGFAAHKLDGKEPVERANAEGFPKGIRVGEVLHAGPRVNAEQAVRGVYEGRGYGWMYSPDHRKEILNEQYNYTLAGSAVAYTDSGVPYYVLMLGVPRT
jgi:uncharacterized protein YkwD